MGDTLLDQFTPDEIEVILAHEIGHHVFRHIRKMIVTGVLYSLLGFGSAIGAAVLGRTNTGHSTPIIFRRARYRY